MLSLSSFFLYRIVASHLLRKGKYLIFKESQINRHTGSGFFLKMLPFSECNVVRISENIQNEISLETFCDVVAYKFINLYKLKAKLV